MGGSQLSPPSCADPMLGTGTSSSSSAKALGVGGVVAAAAVLPPANQQRGGGPSQRCPGATEDDLYADGPAEAPEASADFGKHPGHAMWGALGVSGSAAAGSSYHPSARIPSRSASRQRRGPSSSRRRQVDDSIGGGCAEEHRSAFGLGVVEIGAAAAQLNSARRSGPSLGTVSSERPAHVPADATLAHYVKSCGSDSDSCSVDDEKKSVSSSNGSPPISEAIWSEACSVSSFGSSGLFCHRKDPQPPYGGCVDEATISEHGSEPVTVLFPIQKFLGTLPDLGGEADDHPPPLDDDDGGVALIKPSTIRLGQRASGPGGLMLGKALPVKSTPAPDVTSLDRDASRDGYEDSPILAAGLLRPAVSLKPSALWDSSEL